MPNIANLLCRVSVDPDHVGLLACSYRTGIMVLVHHLRGFDRHHTKNLESGDSGLVVNFELAVKGVPASGIGTRDALLILCSPLLNLC